MPSNNQSKKSGRVVPGDQLGVLEEFESGPGTYVEESVIYSSVTGSALMDFVNKKVSVYPETRILSVPKIGSIVIGQVSETQNKQATVRIFQVGNRIISGFFSGLLHISDVSDRYVEKMYDVCRTGDIIQAKVISNKNRVFHLSTNNKDFGVLYAFCSRCGHMLSFGRTRMRCTECGNIEHRKIAKDYWKGEFQE
jgi:exosome complex component CSL4